MTTQKQESRKARIEIRRVLLDVWDPIGVKDEPLAQDEYDSYLGQIYGLLSKRASVRKYLIISTESKPNGWVCPGKEMNTCYELSVL